MTTTLDWAPIPAWEEQDLESLSSSGELSGVAPQLIGDIDQAESSGRGGGVNPQGYGGFFGLSESGHYPGGTVTPGLLSSTSQSSFDSQASIAASAYASYLTEAGGDPISAEEIYQTGAASGPTEGTGVFESYGVTPTSSGATGATTATDTGIASSIAGGALGGLFGGLFSGTYADVERWASEALLIVAGLAIVVVGVSKLGGGKAEDLAPLAAA